MANDWTIPQLNAIKARGMQVLVSAAAGSGKTTVLTERVKNILSDTDAPCSVSEILVVTFTKAAATEMRDRIFDALRAEMDMRCDNSDYLRRQMIMLPTADICTMDSFCAKIVRENFSKANVGFDFKVLDNKDIDNLMTEALDTVIDELYESDDDAFRKLIGMFIGERNDSLLKSVIVDLYNFSLSYPFPDIWIDELRDSFSVDKTPNDTLWSDMIYKHIGMFADFHKKRLDKTVSLMIESGGFTSEYIGKFTSSSDKLLQLKATVDDRSWDSMVSLIRDGLVCTVNTRNTKVDTDVKEIAKEVYEEFSKDVESIEKHALPLAAEHTEDNALLYPVVSKLCIAVKRMRNVLDQMKSEINSYSFSDILHKCIDLLVFPTEDGSWQRTPLCEELVSRYKEILIDEYQDTNEAQNMIFEALSSNRSNMYVVGDVKQSIYSFRLASPALFMALKHSLSDYDGAVKPSQITLDANFRSRKGVDEAVNYTFTSIMSEAVGDVDYNDREKLAFGAKWYPEKATPDAEIICLDCDRMKSAESTMAEAEVIAKYIKRTVDSGVTVTTKTGDRPIRYSDFCVLLRSVKDRVDHYVSALKEYDIPSCTVSEGDISGYKEMRILVSLMKAISNPMIDIPLISVMMSPLFGFSPDELAEIRLVDSRAELYTCLVKYSEKSRKCRAFLDKLRLYRNISASYPIDEFVRFVIDDTGIADIYLADSDGAVRRENILGFMKFASDFTANSEGGLGSFIRYIDSAIENDRFRSITNSGSAEGVQFMSIHKSKGLEFPYVIVAGCSKGFNKQDSYGSLILARETGIGMKIRDDEKFSQYHTVSSVGTEKAVLYSGASEELRVLYVAMTRAKEHITFVCSVSGKQLSKRVRLNNLLSFDTNGKLHPYAVFRASNVSEWLLSVFARHRDCAVIRDAFKIKAYDEREETFAVDCSYLTYEEMFSPEITETHNKEDAVVDSELLSAIQNKLSFEYNYNYGGILAKISASSTEKNEVKREYFANSKPEFLKTKFTGADRGTAIHKFLEKCDFRLAKENISAEKGRLLELGIINEKELDVVSDNDLKKFFDDPIVARLIASDEFLKEYEFSVLKKAGEMYPDLSSELFDEEIVVQGKLDCAFIEGDNAVLIDYKSDGITDESVYINIYKPQIDIYSEALEKCKGCKVTERYIYSFKLNKFISI